MSIHSGLNYSIQVILAQFGPALEVSAFKQNLELFDAFRMAIRIPFIPGNG